MTSAMTIQPAIKLEDEFHLNGLDPLLGQWNRYLLRTQILIILSINLVKKKKKKKNIIKVFLFLFTIVVIAYVSNY